nr:MAG TPA: hypothetical protein [Siphoviridae sp. ctuCR5]
MIHLQIYLRVINTSEKSLRNLDMTLGKIILSRFNED